MPCGPRSRAFFAQVAEVSGTRRIAAVLVAFRARRQVRASEIPPGPCSMSTTAKSYPASPAISAMVGEKLRRKMP